MIETLSWRSSSSDKERCRARSNLLAYLIWPCNDGSSKTLITGDGIIIGVTCMVVRRFWLAVWYTACWASALWAEMCARWLIGDWLISFPLHCSLLIMKYTEWKNICMHIFRCYEIIHAYPISTHFYWIKSFLSVWYKRGETWENQGKITAKLSCIWYINCLKFWPNQ